MGNPHEKTYAQEFQEWLDIYYRKNINDGLDDDQVDAQSDWEGELDAEDWIRYAGLFASEIALRTAERFNAIIKSVPAR